MGKVCVFCGRQLASKTLEHVLPQWLIELTGNPKRMAFFGYDKNIKKEQIVRRGFAFGAFRFPSCKECNEKYANLEASAKVIVQKMLLEDCLSESELNTLLDWFDKVRIGLWLGYLYLDGNPLGISPHFYIQHRISRHDRMLAIFKADGNTERLNFAGCDTIAFAQTPSCFSLCINNLCFLNMSYQYLLARRMGFPFPVRTYYMEDETLGCSFSKGRNRIMRPVLKKPIAIKGTELYQPIFFGNVAVEDNEKVKRLYDTKYVRDNCISWEKGIGRVYITRDSKVAVYNTVPSMEWLPERVHDFEELQFAMQFLTFEWQSYMIGKSLEISMEFLSGEERKQMINLINLSKYENSERLKLLNEVKRY
jgi:hypothetical protein